MDPHYNYFVPIIPTQVISQSVDLQSYSPIPIQQISTQNSCSSGIECDSITNTVYNNTSPLMDVPIQPNIYPLIYPLYSSKPFNDPEINSNLNESSPQPLPIPLMSIDLTNIPAKPKDVSIFLDTPPPPKHFSKPKKGSKIQSEKPVSNSNDVVDNLIGQMNEKLHLDPTHTSSNTKRRDNEPSKIAPRGTNMKSDKSVPPSESTTTKGKSKVPAFPEKLQKPENSKITENSPSQDGPNNSSHPKQLSWAVVAATPPKPQPVSQKKSASTPSSVKSSSSSSSKRKENSRQKSHKSNSDEVSATTGQSLKRSSKQKKRMRRSKLTAELREQLLTRFRSRLGSAVTGTPKIPIPAELKQRKRKRLSRLKAGILQDRAARRNLLALIESQMKQLSLQESRSGGSTSEETPKEQSLVKPTVIEIAKPKVVNINLPVFASLEGSLQAMLSKLAEYHDRAFKQTENAPGKRKNTRRFVCGFHEVIKSLKINKVKFFIIANDLEKGAYEIEIEGPAIKVEGKAETPDHEEQKRLKKTNTLAMTLKQAVDMAREQGCPVVMAFKRRQLQKLCHKGAPISCVGVINVAGAEDIAKSVSEQYLKEICNLGINVELDSGLS